MEIDRSDMDRTALVAGSGLVLAVVAVSVALGPTGTAALALDASALVIGAATLALAVRMSRGTPAGSRESLRRTIATLSTAIDAADPFTRGRSARIAAYCARIAEPLGLAGHERLALDHAARLHDIGRVAIHRDVLQKSGRLTTRERRAVETHPEIGYEVLRDIPPLRGAAEIVLCHHERPDGKGYPRGLYGEEIPIGARIVMAAAALDAMITDRPYRQGLPAEDAIEELRGGAGTMFDADVVRALVALHEAGELYRGIDAEGTTAFTTGASGAAPGRATPEPSVIELDPDAEPAFEAGAERETPASNAA